MAKKKPRIRADELPPIAGAMRQIAARLETETPLPYGADGFKAQVDRVGKDQCEAGRLLLAAVEAGAFADDYRLAKIIQESLESTDREAVGDWREHLEFHQLGVFLGALGEWVPERWPDSLTRLAERVPVGDTEHKSYAARLRILADKIEAAWALAQPERVNMAKKTPPRLPEPGKRWAWSLHPLNRGAWPTQQVDDSAVPAGQTIAVVRQRPRYAHFIHKPSEPRGTIQERQKFYLPTPDDLAVVQRLFPQDAPYQPAWARIEAELVAAGDDPDSLKQLNAPALILRLDRLKRTNRNPLAGTGWRVLLSPKEALMLQAIQGRSVADAPLRLVPGGKSPTDTHARGRSSKKRRSLSSEQEADIFEKSRRRCCVCFALKGDTAEKRGQLAHIDHDRTNHALDNFAFLCLEHHDKYDGKTSQSKGMTEAELRRYRERLYAAVQDGRIPGKGHAAGQ
jgi:hypothetical protein